MKSHPYFLRMLRHTVIFASVLAAPVAMAEAGSGTNMEQMQEMMQQRCNYGMGMGPGMMGMGGGMMGGPGMMGGGMGPLGMLDLSTEQHSKINKLQDEHRKKDWEIAGKIMDEQAKLRDLYAADTLDAKKIGAVYGNAARLQQQAVEANVDLHNSIQSALTKEQRDQLKQWQRGMGPRGMMGR